MSKIHAVRFINLNYNNNAIHISDEVFHLCGQSTLLSLRNGGGKSVLVQMMMAPFVHKRYRDSKDRPFESYFTTGKPSFIMVEWALDHNAGYVLTGMMVRRNQDIEQQSLEELEVIQFISEYQEPCIQDLFHLPVVEKGKREITLKSFTACRQLFESYKQDRSMHFFYYDMNNSAQSRQYFEKLKEYRIYYKEWETIIKKVNLKESGLSDLFADCKNEKGLVEKWFLDAVESKLNKEKNRMREFQTILEKYTGQYKENQSKIKRRDTIRLFKEEAEKIQEKALLYQEADQSQKMQENLVIHFIEELNRIREKAQERCEELSTQISAIQQAIARVTYEKLSYEIYCLEDKNKFHASNREMIEMEKDSLEREQEAIEKKLHLFVCAKQQEIVDDYRKSLESLRQKLLVSRQRDLDLEPERKQLGYTLRYHYQEKIKENQQNERQTKEIWQQIVKEISTEKEKLSLLQEELLQLVSSEGALKSKLESYEQEESLYNTRYRENLRRNILGEYEAGALEIRMEIYRQQLEKETKERTEKKKQMERSKEEQRRLTRMLEDLRTEQMQRKFSYEQEDAKKEQYEKELEARRVILRYLNLEEKDLFDTDKILQVSGKKLQEIESLRRNLEKEEDELQKEYHRLTQGKVLELPEEFAAMLKNLGIHAVYGMEWLKKNGYKLEENKKLIASHPFLPYALILSARELEKLSRQAANLYTAFPIPIILREHLENRKISAQNGVIRLEGVSFYMFFNENLLDEEKLQLLVAQKEQEIQKKQEAITVRREEYREYFERQEHIKNQSVTKERYENAQKNLEALTMQIQEADEKVRRTAENVAREKQIAEDLTAQTQNLTNRIEYEKRKIEDFDQLCQEYQKYTEYKKTLEKCQDEKTDLEEKRKLSQSEIEKLLECQKTAETEQENLARVTAKLKECAQRYVSYEKMEETDLKGGTIEELEARYQAITSSISQELNELQAEEQRVGTQYTQAKEYLTDLRKKFGLKDGIWSNTRYNRKEESHQEVLLEDVRRKIALKNSLWNEEDKKIAIIKQQKKERMEKLKEECVQEDPLPKSQIQSQDFESRKNQLLFEERETKKKADEVRKKIQSYDENLTALSEYTHLSSMEEVAWEQDFEMMSGVELRNFKGILIRDYNQKIRERQEAKERLTQLLNQIVRMDIFEEDFYKKPLEVMIDLTYDPSQVLRQLKTVIQSYDSLMEKLQIDIAVIEKEKEKIVELMEDYVHEVHQNLGKIDSNSTITIREKQIKMLKIKLPQWEENENLYHIRLEDFVDEITKKGICIFEKNENAQEYWGTQITTKNLYDTVIGIGNVQIGLYKIEEQREYPITWTEVARNSGGEGFLSAFVILSSLLYYMRKDDSDLFADRNEGKVLLMDNPFAQTNASHLLKPLMDMAKKTNTQLICLTGLGGESIYNRFDNIYVLNLIAANLRSEMQYVKADHIRGKEIETMVTSQIQVVEQQELLF